MKAIVTGGAGFIGSHIAEKLISMGADVYVIDDLSSGKEENIPDGCTFLDADITVPDEYEGIFKNANVVFNNAASKKNICLKDPVRDLEVNGGGTLQLLKTAVKYNVTKFIHASTGSVYGEVKGRTTEETPTNPVSYYGVSKLAGEKYVKIFNDKKLINATILRYFHVWGDRQETDPFLGGVVAIFREKIKNGLPITIHGSGHQIRQFTHVSDIVNANIQSYLKINSTGKIYNCAADEKTSINDLAAILMDKYYAMVKVEYTDMLEGDIDIFDVDSTKIEEIDIKFENFSSRIKSY